MNIVVIGAHPDDPETQAAGFMARHTADGHQIIMVVASNPGGPERIQASAYAAEEVGADLVFMDWPADYTPTVDRVAEVETVAAGADLILTHRFPDSHQDHRNLSQIVSAVVRRNQIGLWWFDHSIPGGLSAHTELNTFVDYTGFEGVKKAAVLAHECQWEWWPAIEARDSYYGGMCGTGLVEGFSLIHQLV